VHGSNARYVFHDGNLYIGSHNNIKRKDGKNVWHKVAERLNFDEKLRAYPNKIFFGEVYGTVQKGFGYNLKENTFILFDIFDLKQNKYLDWPEVVAIGEELGLKMVPVIYQGPWVSVEHLEPMAEGTTIVGDGKHIREGIVVRTYPERWDNNIGRVSLKLVGQQYLLQKKNHA
jgi:RNA ligase (TIGR02306 family)